MFDKILIPLDGSALSDGVLPFVRRLVLEEPSELVLVRVVTREDLAALTLVEARDAARRHLESVAAMLAERGIRASCEVLTGDAAGEILAWVDEHRPPLVAMASHGRSGITRWVRGSVAERVLHACASPLLIANPIGVSALPWWGAGEGSAVLMAESAFKKILVPLDGSERANAVIPLVAGIGRLHGSEVKLLHVARPGRESVPSSAFEPALVGLAGVKCSLEIASGKPAPVILDTVTSGLFDLVALSTHGETGDARWPSGSTAEHVLRYCPVPLLVQRTVAAARTPGTPRSLAAAATT